MLRHPPKKSFLPFFLNLSVLCAFLLCLVIVSPSVILYCTYCTVPGCCYSLSIVLSCSYIHSVLFLFPLSSGTSPGIHGQAQSRAASATASCTATTTNSSSSSSTCGQHDVEGDLGLGLFARKKEVLVWKSRDTHSEDDPLITPETRPFFRKKKMKKCGTKFSL